MRQMSKNVISFYIYPSTVEGRHILLGKGGGGVTVLTRDE